MSNELYDPFESRRQCRNRLISEALEGEVLPRDSKERVMCKALRRERVFEPNGCLGYKLVIGRELLAMWPDPVRRKMLTAAYDQAHARLSDLSWRELWCAGELIDVLTMSKHEGLTVDVALLEKCFAAWDAAEAERAREEA